MYLVFRPPLKFIFVKGLDYQSAIFVCVVWFYGLGGFGNLPPILKPLGEQFHAICGPLCKELSINLTASNQGGLIPGNKVRLSC